MAINSGEQQTELCSNKAVNYIYPIWRIAFSYNSLPLLLAGLYEIRIKCVISFCYYTLHNEFHSMALRKVDSALS